MKRIHCFIHQYLIVIILFTFHIQDINAQNICNTPQNMEVISSNGMTQFSWSGTEQAYIHAIMLWDKTKNRNSNAYSTIGNFFQTNDIPNGSYRWRIIPICNFNSNIFLETNWTWGQDFEVNNQCPLPSVSNAGNDQLNITGLSTTLTATNPAIGNGQWSIVQGSGGSFSNTSQPNSTFTGIPGTAYTLRWTVSNTCGSHQDEVNIGFSIPAPKNLAIYYGWPSYVNQSSGNIQTAIQHFKDFNIIVLGDDEFAMHCMQCIIIHL